MAACAIATGGSSLRNRKRSVTMTNTPCEPLGIAEALSILTAEQEAALPSPEGITELLPKSIGRLEAVFQPRDLEGRLLEDDQHLKVLASHVGDKPDKPNMLDHVEVWWSGQRWYVIDGHHRLLAYKMQKVCLPIPVVVFEGTLDEAVARSAAANSKDKLPMTLDDKLNMAWRLTLHFRLSKRQVRKACAVSEGSVATMRKAKKELLESGVTLDDIPERWKDAKDVWEGNAGLEDFDPDEAHRKQVARFARELGRRFGDRMYKYTEAFADALAYCDDRLPSMIMETPSWREKAIEIVRAAELADADCDY